MKPVRLALVGLVELLAFVRCFVHAAWDHSHFPWNPLAGRRVLEPQ